MERAQDYQHDGPTAKKQTVSGLPRVQIVVDEPPGIPIPIWPPDLKPREFISLDKSLQTRANWGRCRGGKFFFFYRGESVVGARLFFINPEMNIWTAGQVSFPEIRLAGRRRRTHGSIRTNRRFYTAVVSRRLGTLGIFLEFLGTHDHQVEVRGHSALSFAEIAKNGIPAKHTRRAGKFVGFLSAREKETRPETQRARITALNVCRQGISYPSEPRKAKTGD